MLHGFLRFPKLFEINLQPKIFILKFHYLMKLNSIFKIYMVPCVFFKSLSQLLIQVHCTEVAMQIYIVKKVHC